MKITLIQPLYKEIYKRIKGIRYLDPPLGLLYIAAVLRQDGHAVSIIDAEAEGAEDHRRIAKKVRAQDPDLVGLSFTTPMLSSAVNAIELIKKELPNVPVIVGGPHVSADPVASLEATGASIAVIGEGETTARELVSKLSRGESLTECRGICIRSDGNITRTQQRPFIKELDTLPFPARDLLKIEVYQHASSQSRKENPYYTNVISSRGCPFKCIFCGSAAVFGDIIRYRSPSRVVDEIDECMRRFRIGIFSIVDDTLTISKSHVLGICDEIASRGLRPLWMAQARVDTIDEQILRAMKNSGCEEIHFGYESGSQEILDNIKKGITVEQSVRATGLARKAGMKIHGDFMIGNPGETEKTVRQTIELAKKLDPDTAQFTLAQPFPGTELYRIATKSGPKERRFDHYRWYETVNYIPAGLTREKLLALHRRAFREFYFRPCHVVKTLRRLRSPKNWGWVISGLRSFWNITRKR